MNINLSSIQDDIEHSVRFALKEDIRDGDITALLIPADQQDTAEVITREDCVVCGIAWFEETFTQLGQRVELDWHVCDGDEVKVNTKLVTLKGNTRDIVTGERTALNFLQTLSGTATTSRRYAEAVKNTQIKILDTRKTLPGLRMAQKYAVATGGCHNHRIGLYDAFLIKENHIAACGGISHAIAQARQIAPDKTVEIEVESITELEQAIQAKADIIMLDNFSHKDLRKAFSLDEHESQFEISGNIDLNNLDMSFANTKHFVSSGALTKHCRAIDLSLKISTAR